MKCLAMQLRPCKVMLLNFRRLSENVVSSYLFKAVRKMVLAVLRGFLPLRQRIRTLGRKIVERSIFVTVV